MPPALLGGVGEAMRKKIVTPKAKGPERKRRCRTRAKTNASRTFALPDDLLLLLESLVEQINLHGKRVARRLLVEVFEVLIVRHGLKVDR